MGHESNLLHYVVAAATRDELAALAATVGIMPTRTFTLYARECAAAGLEAELLPTLVAAPRATPRLRVEWAHRHATDATSAAEMFGEVAAGVLARAYREFLGTRLSAAKDHVVDAVIAAAGTDDDARAVFVELTGAGAGRHGKPGIPFPQRHIDSLVRRIAEVCLGSEWVRSDLHVLSELCRVAPRDVALDAVSAFRFDAAGLAFGNVDMGPVLDVVCNDVLARARDTGPQHFLDLLTAVAHTAPWAVYPDLGRIAARFEAATGTVLPLDVASLHLTGDPRWPTCAELFEACASPNPPTVEEVERATSGAHAHLGRYALYLLGANPAWPPADPFGDVQLAALRQGFLTRRGAEPATVAAAMDVFGYTQIYGALAACAEDPASAIAAYISSASTPSLTYQRVEAIVEARLLDAEVIARLDAAALHSGSTDLLTRSAASLIGRWLLDRLDAAQLPLAAQLCGDVSLSELVHLVEVTELVGEEPAA